jgi:hypothetical protein
LLMYQTMWTCYQRGDYRGENEKCNKWEKTQHWKHTMNTFEYGMFYPWEFQCILIFLHVIFNKLWRKEVRVNMMQSLSLFDRFRFRRYLYCIKWNILICSRYGAPSGNFLTKELGSLQKMAYSMVLIHYAKC